MNYNVLWIGPLKPLTVLTSSEVLEDFLYNFIVCNSNNRHTDHQRHLLLLHCYDEADVIC